MTWLIAGLLAFLGFHLLPANTEVRGRLVAALGANGYRALFSAVSLIAFVLLVWGYAQSPFIAIWTPPAWTRYATAVLMAAAFVILMASFFPGSIKRRLKHPMLVAIKIWALAHLLANGDLASILLFAAFLAYAVIDRILVKRRERAPGGTPANAWNDMIAVVTGLALYAAFMFGLHEWLIGVPVLL